MLLPFLKYEGTANDFLVIERSELDPEVVRRLCDRHRGVGGDGVLLVSRTERGHRMIVRNADGSRPEMCGNGVRCVALHLARTGAASGEVTIETDAGPRTCLIEREGDRAEVTVDMGVVELLGETTVAHEGRAVRLFRADAGNPHAVTLDVLDEAGLDALGARLQTDALFPQGVNLERVVLGDDAVDVDVFERGVGRTLACGTGACAAAATLVAQGLRPSNEPMLVRLSGGALRITVTPGSAGRAHVRMRGPARFVFEGRVEAG